MDGVRQLIGILLMVSGLTLGVGSILFSDEPSLTDSNQSQDVAVNESEKAQDIVPDGKPVETVERAAKGDDQEFMPEEKYKMIYARMYPVCNHCERIK